MMGYLDIVSAAPHGVFLYLSVYGSLRTLFSEEQGPVSSSASVLDRAITSARSCSVDELQRYPRAVDEPRVVGE
jgi:hypothetical protein